MRGASWSVHGPQCSYGGRAQVLWLFDAMRRKQETTGKVKRGLRARPAGRMHLPSLADKFELAKNDLVTPRSAQ